MVAKSGGFDSGSITDATSTKENLQRWEPRPGTHGWPPPARVIAGLVSRWEAVLQASLKMADLGMSIPSASVLEVGAGYGDGLRPLLSAGFSPANMTGVDLLEERLEIARERLPGVTFLCANAGDMKENFESNSFDVVFEQFCCCHVPDEELKQKMASEMIRIAKPNGFILIHDWRRSASWRGIYGVSQSYIDKNFKVYEEVDKIKVYPSLLWPPLGGRLSRYIPELYQAIRLAPFFVGANITLLRKRKAE